jgi:hypothetical protein
MNQIQAPLNETTESTTRHEPWWHTLLGTLLSALIFAIGWLCL